MPRRALALVLEWAQEHRAELMEHGGYAQTINRHARFLRYHNPEIRPRMPWRVVEVTPLEGFRLSVRFVDGAEGTVDMSGLIQSSRAGVFAKRPCSRCDVRRDQENRRMDAHIKTEKS